MATQSPSHSDASGTKPATVEVQDRPGEEVWTKVEEIEPIYRRLLATFKRGKTRPLAWRKEQILRLGEMIQHNEPAFCAALHSDFGRPPFETTVAELNPMKAEINLVLSSFERWARPELVSTDWMWMAAKPCVRREPKGVVLVVGTWNYPITLLLTPLLGAIAAGCTAIIKPSELAPSTALLISRLLPLYLDPSSFACVLGGLPQTSVLLNSPSPPSSSASPPPPPPKPDDPSFISFNHIFYTGSSRVGRIVAEAAGRMLCPVTLELGGKSPAVVLENAEVEVCARRIAWAKWANAGQICIAPDYILTLPHLLPSLLTALRASLASFSSSPSLSPLNDPNYSRIISPAHFDRLNGLLEKTQGKIEIGGERDREKGKIEVTVVSGVEGGDSLMSEELFGPLLPILTLPSKEAMADFINARDVPLALYVFSQKQRDAEYFLNNTQSGTFLHNDCLVQFMLPNLPFGGQGGSGYGGYHGRRTFDTFTHERACAKVPTWMDKVMSARYPPYTPGKLRFLLLATGSVIRRPAKFGIGWVLKLVGVLAAVIGLVKAYAGGAGGGKGKMA